MKTCTKCGQAKEMFDFSRNRSRASGYNSWCKACVSTHVKEHNEKNPNRKLERIAYNYGLTKLEYEQLLQKANYSCQVCKTTDKRLTIDHDSKTGNIRGILCDLCNLAIGLFRHDTQILNAAARYLAAAPTVINLGYYFEKLSRQQSQERRVRKEITQADLYIRGLKKRRNLNLAEYEHLLQRCNSKCNICQLQIQLQIDHCHKTMQVRGLLCANCNHSIGLFKHKVETIQLAISYLENAKELKPNIFGLLSQKG